MRMADIAMLNDEEVLAVIIKYDDGENSGKIYLTEEDLEGSKVRFSQSKDIELIEKINEDILSKVGNFWEEEYNSINYSGVNISEVEKYSPHKIVEFGNNFTNCIKNFDDLTTAFGEYFVCKNPNVLNIGSQIFICLDSTEPKLKEIGNTFRDVDLEVYEMYRTKTLKYHIYMTEEQAKQNKIFKKVDGNILENSKRINPNWPKLDMDYYNFEDGHKRELLASLGYSLDFSNEYLDKKFKKAYKLVCNSREIYDKIIHKDPKEWWC